MLEKMDSEHVKRDMSPVIIAAVEMLKKVEGVEYVKLHGDLMHEVDGELGANIIIKGEAGHSEHFLSMDEAAEIVQYPKGGFFSVEYVHELMKLDNPKTFLKDDSDE